MPSLGLAEARTWQLKIQRWRREPQAPHSGGSAPCSCRLPSDSRRRCGSSCAQPGGSVPETCSSCIWNTCALARHSTSPAPSTPCRTHTHAALHVHRTSLVSRVCSPLARRQAAPRAPGSSPAFGVGADACAVRQPRPPPFRPQLPRVSRSALSHTHRCSAALPAPPSKQPMQASRQEAGGRCARASRLCSAPPVTSGSVPVSAPLLQHANVFWIGLLETRSARSSGNAALENQTPGSVPCTSSHTRVGHRCSKCEGPCPPVANQHCPTHWQPA